MGTTYNILFHDNEISEKHKIKTDEDTSYCFHLNDNLTKRLNVMNAHELPTVNLRNNIITRSCLEAKKEFRKKRAIMP